MTPLKHTTEKWLWPTCFSVPHSFWPSPSSSQLKAGLDSNSNLISPAICCRKGQRIRSLPTQNLNPIAQTWDFSKLVEGETGNTKARSLVLSNRENTAVPPLSRSRKSASIKKPITTPRSSLLPIAHCMGPQGTCSSLSANHEPIFLRSFTIWNCVVRSLQHWPEYLAKVFLIVWPKHCRTRGHLEDPFAMVVVQYVCISYQAWSHKERRTWTHSYKHRCDRFQKISEHCRQVYASLDLFVKLPKFLMVAVEILMEGEKIQTIKHHVLREFSASLAA